MIYSIQAPGAYLQGEDVLDQLGVRASAWGTRFLVVCSPNNQKRIGKRLEDSLTSVPDLPNGQAVFFDFQGECSWAEVNRAAAACREAGCDGIIGAGGGKAIDTAKTAAKTLGGLPVIIVPTVASNDAPCSGIADLYYEDGTLAETISIGRNPNLVLVDTGIIARAPARLLASGIGDALATYYEARATWRSGADTLAGGRCSNTALMMSRLCYDILLRDGLAALRAVEAQSVNQALEHVVEAAIYLSGVGFESGGLAAAHPICDGLTLLPAVRGMYHGEKVAFGTLTQLVLERAGAGELCTVLSFLSKVKLPMCFADLGLLHPTQEELRKVAQEVCAPYQFTKNLSPDITPDDVYAALLQADALGRQFQQHGCLPAEL